MSFTHLHVHTEYSLLDGSSKIKEITKQAKELGMDSLAITDHGVMYGAIDFYEAALDAGIKPIIGCEVYVSPGSRFEKKQGDNENRYYHLILLAENNLGYHNLCKIVSRGFTEGFYYKPRVDYEVLEKYSEGIICLSACLAGEVARHLAVMDYEGGVEAAKRYINIFGKDNYFLELQDHGIPEQRTVNQQLIRMSKELGVGLVCTNDVHYTYKDDATAHDILLCIQTGKKQADEDRMRYEGGQYYLKSPEEMAELFKYIPEALENTAKIAERCNVSFVFNVNHIPSYEVPEGYTTESYLRMLCEDGLIKRYGASREDEKYAYLWDRLDFEIKTIAQMGYLEYFLIVWDFIHYAKSNGIAVGPGRGSAAGSIVSYCLEITDIDPMRYDLLFERFLNPERVSMPDIDVDFCIERRQEVIDYVANKYGKDHVAQIVTFGTLKARGVIRDVGRVLDMPYAQVDNIAKMVPQELNITLDGAMKENKELKQLYDTDPEVKNLIDMSKRLEGLPRHASMHAAGVVICGKPVDEFVPLSTGADGTVTTQYIMTTLERLGLLKMDFLGLRNLTVIQNAQRFIKKNRGIDLDLSKIDYDDKDVLSYIGTGNTDGIFQLESGGMKSFMKELRPSSLEDIIAGISLYRPGPMDFIPQYLKGKNDPESVTYDTPQLEPILKPTYGCIVYQEQVMQIVRSLAGYSLGASDILRRAMSKKKSEVMNAERTKFVYGDGDKIPGCIKNGIDEKIANKIYDEMLDFAKYAFNKSHAAAYAVVAYQTAYLKYYYAPEFMAAMLSSVMESAAKISEYVYTCRTMGIKILPPDVNEGGFGFSVEGGNIRYGLNAIKGVGKVVSDAIVEERINHGKYTDIENFLSRVVQLGVNKRTAENLIKAGALDCLGANRRQMIMVYQDIIDGIGRDKKSAMIGQVSFFDLEPENDMYKFHLPNVPEFEIDVKLANEKEVLGIYASGHPLESVENKWKKKVTANSLDFISGSEEEVTGPEDGQRVTVGGMIENVTDKLTRNGDKMAFVTLEDLLGTMEIIIFPRQFRRFSTILRENSKVFVEGTVNREASGEAKLIADKVYRFEDVPDQVCIRFETMEDYQSKIGKLSDFINNHRGIDKMYIYISSENKYNRLDDRFSIDACEDNILELTKIFGEDNIQKS